MSLLRLLNVIILSLVMFPVVAQATFQSSCGQKSDFINQNNLKCLLKELIDTSFPELKRTFEDGQIVYREFSSKSYFLKTGIRKGILARESKHRIYSVDVNPRIYEKQTTHLTQPTLYAIQGILAHELVHLVNYEESAQRELLRLLLNLAVKPTVSERSTDQAAFERGYADQIKVYREWIYQQLNPRELAIKKKRYYTPSEIDDWIDKHDDLRQ